MLREAHVERVRNARESQAVTATDEDHALGLRDKFCPIGQPWPSLNSDTLQGLFMPQNLQQAARTRRHRARSSVQESSSFAKFDSKATVEVSDSGMDAIE